MGVKLCVGVDHVLVILSGRVGVVEDLIVIAIAEIVQVLYCLSFDQSIHVHDIFGTCNEFQEFLADFVRFLATVDAFEDGFYLVYYKKVGCRA